MLYCHQYHEYFTSFTQTCFYHVKTHTKHNFRLQCIFCCIPFRLFTVKKKKKTLLKWLNKTRRQCSAPAHDDDDDVDDGGSGGDEDLQSASCWGSQFLAVRTTDVTKLPKATTRAPSINFQESPWKRHKQQEESRWSQNRTCLHIFCWGSQMVSSWRE